MATAIELYGFARDRKSKDEAPLVSNTNLISSGPAAIQQQFESAEGPITNVAGGVKGDVLSGEFSGPVAVDGEAVDFRGSTGATYKPTIQKREKLPVPRLQRPPQDFTGREEELGRLLSHFDRGATITGLWAAGGIGKTALALELADKLKSRFADGQIFLRLEGMSPNPVKPADAMAQVIRAFRGSEENLPEDQNELQRLFNSVLEGKKVLMLLDNAADDKQVLQLLPPSGCAVLITSRKKFALPGMPEPFPLYALKPSEARELLRKICTRLGSQAEELAKLCGCLPLALRATASLLAVKSDLNPSDYLEELRSEHMRLEKIGKEGVDIDVEASINLSYIRLPADTASIFCMLSVFPSDFDAHAEEFVCQDESHRNLSELVTMSLVEFLESGRYRLHDLIRVFASSRLVAGAREMAQQRHAKYYQELLWKANALYLQGGDYLTKGLIQFDVDWTNIQTGQRWTKANKDKSNEIANICSNYAWEGSVLNLRLHPLRNIEWQKEALAAARKTKNQNAEVAHLGNLGSAYSDLGETRKAIESYEQALKISQEIGDLKGEGKAIGNLGNAYSELGKLKKAIEFYEQALKIAREIGDRRSEGDHIGNLGNAYYHLGETRKAIEFYEQAIKISQEIRDRRGEGASLGNLGLAYSELGESKKAIEFYEQALKIAREIGDRRGEGRHLGNLGSAYYHLGEHLKAIDLYEQALKIAREIGDHRGEGCHLGNLGSAYYHLGEHLKAIEINELALKIAREIGDRRSEGYRLFNMSISFRALGQKEKSVSLAKSALAIFEQIESPNAETVRQKLAEWGA